MSRYLTLFISLMFAAGAAFAQDAQPTDEPAPMQETEQSERADTSREDEDTLELAAATDASPGAPKTLSGMSILGNEEAPKSLVIVPWKSSEIGDGLGVTDAIDERARPVDKEVFLREVHYYELRSGAGG